MITTAHAASLPFVAAEGRASDLPRHLELTRAEWAVLKDISLDVLITDGAVLDTPRGREARRLAVVAVQRWSAHWGVDESVLVAQLTGAAS